MIQSKLVRDQINYHKHGLEYALEQITKEYICQRCGLKHNHTENAQECCK